MSTEQNIFAEGRRLPSFVEWLEKVGDGRRGDGYEDWASLERFAQREITRDPGSLTESEQSFFRIWQGLSVAIVELCRIEAEKHGRSVEEILQAMPRAAGAMTLYAFASTCRPNTPWRTLSRVLIEEFRHGANRAADALARS